jgi:hypothetical protein
MQAAAFWKAITTDTVDFLGSAVTLLDESLVHYCVIGGQAVNAYVDPLVSLDLDLVVAAEDYARAAEALESRFRVQPYPGGLAVSTIGSHLRIQIHTDPRYVEFVARARPRVVLGRTLPVAMVEDVLRGKVWAALAPERRASRRQKHLADIARLLESFPELAPLVPYEVHRKLA